MKPRNIPMFFILGIHYVASNRVDFGIIIGIDIGNTFSSVGIFRNGKVEIVEDEFGNRVQPSAVSFSRNGTVLDVRDAQTRNSSNSLFDLKYLIGKSFENKNIRGSLNNWPFELIDRNNQPLFKIPSDFDTKFFTPEDVTAFLFKHLKEMAESLLDQEVHKCILTHPVYFDNKQRVAIKEAAKFAGLEVVQLIKEPIAAALALRLEKQGNNRKILVYHLGGSSLDVTLLELEDGVFEVIANRGNINLGGRNFNARVVNYLMKMYETKTNQVLDQETIESFLQNVEKAKIALSTQNQVQIEINGEFEILTRGKFEELNVDLFETTIEFVSQVFKDSYLNKTDIHDVVLIGGSTRIPKVRELVRSFFDGKESVSGVEPDLAVVTGAVIAAGKMQGPPKTMFEATVDWIVSKLFWTGNPPHDELK